MQNLKVTLIQADTAWRDVPANLARLDRIVPSLRGATDLVLLPEMFTTGFTMEPGSVAEGMDGSTVRQMTAWADILQADVAGSVVAAENNRFFNRLVWARPGGTMEIYDKRHLFRMAGEEKIYTAGERLITAEIRGWRIRPFICYDLRFPAWSRSRGLEYDVAVYAANWPESRSLHWKTLLRARAIENQCYVIGVNRIGTDGNGVRYRGDSMAIDFSGAVIADCASRECVQSVELDCRALQKYRGSFPAWKDADSYTFQ